MSQKIIAIVGATGAQGLPVVKHLLEAGEGQPSPYKVRALTRDLEHPRAKELLAAGVELVKGTYTDYNALTKLLDGVYGVYVNTDSFSSTPGDELVAAFNLWEIANWKKVRHFVWSGMDYPPKHFNYDPTYNAAHFITKGRFGEFLKSQPSDVNGTMWSILSPEPYMEMLGVLFAPVNIRADGTRVFANPLGRSNKLGLIALDDIGWWARYILENASSNSGQDVRITSDIVSFPEIAKTFTRVTGLPAEYVELSVDAYFALFEGTEAELVPGAGGISWEANFRAAWAIWRDRVFDRDMDWIRSVHEPTTLERWMRETEYMGQMNPRALKRQDTGSRVRLIREKTSLL